MQLTLENKAIGRSVCMEVSDAFMNNVEDVRLIAGTECYKLVSTKSDKDKKRETLGMEFANDVFPVLQKTEFADDDSLKKAIEDKLHEDKYKELLEISDKEMLLTTMVTSYRRYAAISQRLFDLDKEIKDTIVDQNTFYDYIARLRKLISESKCLKEFHDGIFKLKEMSQCDERSVVAPTVIFDCATPLLEEERTLINEAKEANKGVDITTLPIFTDRDFWLSRFDSVASECINRLDALRKRWKTVEYRLSTKEDGTPIPKTEIVPKFKFFLDGIISALRPVVDATMKFKALIRADNDAVEIEKTRGSLKTAISTYHKTIKEYEILESVYPIPYKNHEECVFIGMTFFEYRELESAAEECVSTGEQYSWQEYLMKLTINYQVCMAIKANRIDLKRLLEKGYEEEELRNLLVPESPSVNTEVK